MYDSPTITELHDTITDGVILSSNTVPTAGTTVGLANVIGVAESAVWDYDLADLWLTSTRWDKLVTQYLNPAELEHWLDLIESRLRKRRANVAVMRTNQVQGNVNRTIVTRRFGSCMNYISFTSRPKPQILLDSRTCYMGYMSGLDLTFAMRCAELAAEAAGVNVEDITFRWNIGMAQFNSEKGLGYLIARGVDDYVDTAIQSPCLRRIRETLRYINGLDEAGTTYEEMKFASRRRIRQRYHTAIMPAARRIQFGPGVRPYPSVMASELEL